MSLTEQGIVIRVLRADAACLSHVLQARSRFDENVGNFDGWRQFYILNFVDPRRQLCRDIESIAQEALGESLLFSFRFDACVPDAVADGQLVSDYSPHSQATSDFSQFADRLQKLAISSTEKTSATERNSIERLGRLKCHRLLHKHLTTDRSQSQTAPLKAFMANR